MPVVPKKGVGEVRSIAQPTPVSGLSAPIAAFGGAEAQSLQRFGSVVGDIGGAASDLAIRRQNDQNALDVLNALSSGVAETDVFLKTGDDPIYGRKGGDARDISNEASQFFDEVGGRLSGELNPNAQNAFSLQWTNFTRRQLSNISGYQLDQIEFEKKVTLDRRMESLKNEVLADPFDSSTFNSALLQGNGAIRALIQNEQLANDMFEDFRSDLILSNAAVLGSTSPEIALSFLDQLGTVNNRVDQVQVSKLRVQLLDDLENKNAFELADMAAGIGGIEAQADFVDEQTDVRGGGFTVDEARKAITILGDRARREGISDVTERENRLKITLKYVNDGGRIEDLSLEEKAQLRFDKNLEFIIEYEGKLVRGEMPGPGNTGVFLDLLKLSGSPDIEDINNFIGTPIEILHAQGVLSESQAEKLIKEQNKARQNLDAFKKDQHGIRSEAKVLELVLNAAKLGDKDVKNVDDLRRSTLLQAELEGLKEEFRIQNGRPPTSDELQSLGLGLLTKIEIPRFNKQTRKLSEEFVEREFFTLNLTGERQNIPRAVAGIIADGLTLVDEEPTPENIRVLAQGALERGIFLNKLLTAQDYADIWREIVPEEESVLLRTQREKFLANPNQIRGFSLGGRR
ncbi:hypothetical protein LCGC14_0414230 [marine sediment metagenome]|uniref:Uncharacterized protein n=1 Tax=marine sediment metagenome TaxID=412755 RepID=A0A0F9TAZ2_9ZZZZ